MTHEEIMLTEKVRVQKLLTAALDEIEAEGGSIRFFAAALLGAAIETYAEVEGPEAVERGITKMALRKLGRAGAINAC